MRIVKFVFWTVLILLVAGFLHYNLPRHDVVRIVGVETRLETFGINRFFYASAPSGSGESEARDVRYIETIEPDGSERIFRNEDTGWGWPPYFKHDSADMQAKARDNVSTSDDPDWVVITHYGWRNRLLSIYPNAVSMRVVDGPDARVFPWASVVILVLLAGLTGWLWLIWRRFRERRLDPFLESVDEQGDAAMGRLRKLWRRLAGRR